MPVGPCTHCGHPQDVHSTTDGVCLHCSLAEGPCAVVVGIISYDASINRSIEVYAGEAPSASIGAPGDTETGLICYLLMFPGNSTIDHAIEHLRSVLELPGGQALSLIDPVSDAQVQGQRAVGPWDNQLLVLRTERRNG